MKLEKRAYIGLGANLGDRIENCIKALGLLSTHPEIEVLRCSQWYETEPEDRPIDLDLLFMEGVRIQTSNHQITKSPNHQIQVPHPRLSTRRFVLAPWAELSPDLLLAPWSKTVSELLAELPEDSPEVRQLNHKETREGY
jgi:2-amino-4-hydroxy-6-hydroxymethyldihydropteridine diphosphokinase